MPFHFHTIHSQHLAGNLLGDSPVRQLVVYTPPGLEKGAEKARLCLLLHGYSGRALNWALPEHFKGSGRRPSFETELDRLFSEAGVAKAVIAMPDGWTALGGGQWLNSPVNGDFQNYLIDEVVDFVEREYAAGGEPEDRVVIGHSSGGLGAWEAATTNFAFGGLGFLAGDAFFERTHLGFVFDLITRSQAFTKKSPGEISPDEALPLALAASYAPNPETGPCFGDLPLDIHTGELRPDVWSRWLAYDPVVNAALRVDALRRLKKIYLDVGKRDEYGAQLGQRMLSRELGKLGVAHIAEEFEGAHSSHTLQRIVEALRVLLKYNI